ncbi:MAG: peptide deformylase [Gemmatimonadales bacterium]|jgi:peptide deformylase|nr:peptide deformylase [Gemmatimonadales bacterium]
MAILPIHLLGSPVLREPAAAVAEFDDSLRAFVADLYDTMDVAMGVGLAANQVGRAVRVAVIDADDHRFAMVNPQVVAKSGSAAAEEGCLSIPDAFAEVTRPERITLEAHDEHGAPFRLELEGLAARAVQHEIDHLDGVLFIDHLSMLKKQLLVTRWKKENKGSGLTRIPTAEESEAKG